MLDGPPPAHVRDLQPGDVIVLDDRTATFIAQVPHPDHHGFMQVVWRLDDGFLSFDCLLPGQEVGQRVELSSADRIAQLRMAIEGPARPELEECGWLGVDLTDDAIEEFDSLEEAEEHLADVPLEGGEVLREFEGRWYIVRPGEWVLRHEDGSADLLNPIPILVDAAALATYVAEEA